MIPLLGFLLKVLSAVSKVNNVLKSREVCTECSSSYSRCHQSQIFISLCCEITARLPNLMGQLTDIIAVTNCSFFLIAEFYI